RRLGSAICFAAILITLPIRAEAATACVWRVTNVKHPFYLVGSSHALAKRDYPLPAPYEEALNAGQRFLFEYDPNLDGTFSRQFDQAAVYPHGQDIRRHVHPQTYLYLVKAFRISSL